MTYKNIIETVQRNSPNIPHNMILQEIYRIQSELAGAEGSVLGRTVLVDSQNDILFTDDLANAISVVKMQFLDNNDEEVDVSCRVDIDRTRGTIVFYDIDGTKLTGFPEGVAKISVWVRRKPAAVNFNVDVSTSPELDDAFHGIFEAGIMERECAREKNYDGARYWYSVKQYLRVEYKRHLNNVGDLTNPDFYTNVITPTP